MTFSFFQWIKSGKIENGAVTRNSKSPKNKKVCPMECNWRPIASFFPFSRHVNTSSILSFPILFWPINGSIRVLRRGYSNLKNGQTFEKKELEDRESCVVVLALFAQHVWVTQNVTFSTSLQEESGDSQVNEKSAKEKRITFGKRSKGFGDIYKVVDVFGEDDHVPMIGDSRSIICKDSFQIP